jgi:uncharacterized protein (TIGR03067 family)
VKVISGKRSQVFDERELRLQVGDEPLVCGDEFAFFLFAQGNVQAVEKTRPRLGGDGHGPEYERPEGVEDRLGGQNVGQVHHALASGNGLLALRLDEGIGVFAIRDPGRRVPLPQPGFVADAGAVDSGRSDWVCGWVTTEKKETRYITAWQGSDLRLEPAATPRTIWASQQVGLKMAALGGIYRIDGDTLTVGFNFNRRENLPKEFKSARGSEVLLLTMKRAK